MEIIQFVPTSRIIYPAFTQYLDKQLKGLLKDHFKYYIAEKEKNVLMLICKQHPIHLTVTEVMDTFRHFFSLAVAEYLVEELEQKLIEGIIKQNFHYKEKEQITSIYRYCQQILFMEEETSLFEERKVEERKGKIFKKAYQYLAEERVFDLEGFIQFRLKYYCQDLRNVVAHAIDEYIVEKEYQEFVQLIRNFISTQPSKVPLLHVVQIQDRHFVLYNGQRELVTEDEIKRYLRKWTSQKVSFEDMLVTTLISMAPKKIIVHTDDPSNTVIQTLKNIFAEQIRICRTCLHCTIWKSQLLQNKVSESVHQFRT